MKVKELVEFLQTRQFQNPDIEIQFIVDFKRGNMQLITKNLN